MEIIAVEKKTTSKHHCKICKAKAISNDQTINCGIMEVVQRRVSLAKLDEEQDIASQTNVLTDFLRPVSSEAVFSPLPTF
jgi:hypothetical protein